MNYLPTSRRPQSPPYDPLQRRLLGLAGLLAALMIALIVFHALHTGSTGLNAVAEAAERTARQPGAKLAMEVTYTIEGVPGQTGSTPVVGNGGGSFDARTGRTEITLTVPLPGRSPVSIESVGDERQVFMRSPVFAEELPPGKEWLGMEPFLGHSAETAFGSNGSAKGQLELLSAVGGDVEKLDQQTVRGHLTTRYKGSVELAKAAELLSERGETALAQEFGKVAEQIPGPIPVEAWIDDKGLARQVRVIEPLPTAADGATVTMDMRMQFYAFGTHPKIKFPSKRQVLDFTPVLRAELGLEDGSTLGPLKPADGARPLSAAAFRKQGTAICRRGYDDAQRVSDRELAIVRALKELGHGQVAEGRRLTRQLAERLGRPIYRDDYRIGRELVGLAPPPSIAAEFHHYLHLRAIDTEWQLTQMRLWELGTLELASLKARKAQEAGEEKRREHLASQLGLGICEKDLDTGAADSPQGTIE